MTTLEKLVDLPKGWSLASVECFKNWATATPKRTAPGDGVYLFRYEAGTGWRYHDEGSDWDCKDLGLDEGAPFCSS